MSKRIILNAFDMSCVTHQAPGLWKHPDNQAHRYNDIDYWIDLAKLLERGTFDALFIADVVGIYDVYRHSSAPALIDSAQLPVGDPIIQVSAMAKATEHLGFGVTVASTYELPYALARRFSTLDHFTKGRVGWNVVTSYLDSAARNLGLTTQIKHDDRYGIGEEFLDVTYKLWEGSWEDDAVVIDRENGVYTDPTKVHPINHRGEHFQVPGIHLSEPSPQRTPVIFQAGASARGREFAATHGEAVFINGRVPELTRKTTDDIRDRAEALGRPRDSVKILTLATAIVAETDEEAQAKYEEYQQYISLDGALTLYGGWSGLDFSSFDPDKPLKYVDTDPPARRSRFSRSPTRSASGRRATSPTTSASAASGRCSSAEPRRSPRDRAVDRRRRNRRFQPRLRHHARHLRGRRRPARTRAAPPRPRLGRVPGGHTARPHERHRLPRRARVAPGPPLPRRIRRPAVRR